MAARSNLDLDSDPRVLGGSRVYDAPRALVFAAFTDPKHLANWWGPDGFSITTFSFEFKVGGVWRYVMHGPDGRDYQNRVAFEEIVPNQKIAWQHGGADDDPEPIRFRTVVTFEDEAPGKTRLTWRGTFASAQERARVIRDYGADKGLMQTMARLADYLTTTNA